MERCFAKISPFEVVVEDVFQKSRERFGPKRKDVARKWRGKGEAVAGVLWSMGDLRKGGENLEIGDHGSGKETEDQRWLWGAVGFVRAGMGGSKSTVSGAGLFDSLAQPRDAAATCEEELFCGGAFSIHWHSRETRQPHMKKSHRRRCRSSGLAR